MTQPLGRVSDASSKGREQDLPVTVGPALVLFDGDHSSLAKFALLDLDLANAIGSLAEGAVVWTDLCRSVKFDTNSGGEEVSTNAIRHFDESG